MDEEFDIIPLGTTAQMGSTLERLGLIIEQYPFDYIRCNPNIISDCLDNEFKVFLDKENYEKFDCKVRGNNLIKHKIYGDDIFLNTDLFNENTYKIFKKRIENFINILNNGKKKIFFIFFIPWDEKIEINGVSIEGVLFDARKNKKILKSLNDLEKKIEKTCSDFKIIAISNQINKNKNIATYRTTYDKGKVKLIEFISRESSLGDKFPENDQKQFEILINEQLKTLKKSLKHIIILGMYNLSDGYLSFAKYMRELGVSVSFFPLHLYLEQYREILIDDFKSVIKMDRDKKYKGNVIIEDVKDEITMCLWWYSYYLIDNKIIENIISSNNIKHISFNWDPTYIPSKKENWIDIKNKIEDKCNYFDQIISVNPYEVENLKHRNKVIYCPPGANSHISNPIFNKSYICDVSFVGTTLYDSKTFDLELQNFGRKKIIDLIYSDESIHFNFFGPKIFESLYSKSYKGFMNYNNCNKIFYNSKINICIQMVNIEGYLSERIPQVFMSCGLVLTDTEIKNGFIANEDYILLDKENPLKQIKNLLKDNDLRKKIAYNGYKKSMNLSWYNLYDIIINN